MPQQAAVSRALPRSPGGTCIARRRGGSRIPPPGARGLPQRVAGQQGARAEPLECRVKTAPVIVDPAAVREAVEDGGDPPTQPQAVEADMPARSSAPAASRWKARTCGSTNTPGSPRRLQRAPCSRNSSLQELRKRLRCGRFEFGARLSLRPSERIAQVSAQAGRNDPGQGAGAPEGSQLPGQPGEGWTRRRPAGRCPAAAKNRREAAEGHTRPTVTGAGRGARRSAPAASAAASGTLTMSR